MRIIYDYQIFNQQKYGGISRYICEIASRIAAAEDFEVKILAYSYINKYLEKVDPDLLIGKQRQIIPKTAILFRNINYLLSQIWLNVKTPDIIHETHYSYRRIAPKKCKTVITVYDMIEEKFADLMPDKNIQVCRNKARSIQRADHIICISNSTKQDLLQLLDVNPEKVSVVYLGHSLQLEGYVNLEPEITFKPYILYVGQRERYKNFERFLKAYASNLNILKNFNIVCFGGKLFSHDELEFIRKLGLDEEKVIYLTGKDELLATLYSKASAFVYPSLYEGFGIPLLEAMSFGCPVVCSNTSSFPEVAGEAAEFFNPYEIDSIINALEKVLYSSDRANELSQMGKKRVKDFSWETCAKKTSLIYRSLA
jgi:glycosyltransferase involved in cell wall biosynthesis